MKQYVKLILYPSSINLSWIEDRRMAHSTYTKEQEYYVVSCFVRKMRHGWKQMICHTTKTKEWCRTHHRQAIFNCAAKKYSRESNVHARAWLTSWASPLVYNAIIFVWMELLTCHMKWKCERNVGHLTSTWGRLASARDITCDLYRKYKYKYLRWN